MIPPAFAYPNVPIVLAHAGMGVASKEAEIVAQTCDNVWLETSWCSILDVASILQSCGPERLMFGGDAPENVAVELARWNQLGLDHEKLGRCLGGTAIEVFAV